MSSRCPHADLEVVVSERTLDAANQVETWSTTFRCRECGEQLHTDNHRRLLPAQPKGTARK